MGAIKPLKGPVVKLGPHDESFADGDEKEFIKWARTVQAPKAMDLFCGAGGLSLGLDAAGYEVVLGVDHDREALETHRANFPGLSVDWDLSNEEVVDRVVDLGKAARIDLVAGGPPCQPFSRAGRSMIRELVRSGRRNEKDHRRDLWQSFVAVIDGIRPRAVLMENVPDMALDIDMQILRTMVDLLESMDYSVSVNVLEASRYEVPQVRQRLILVALARQTRFVWPHESSYQVTLHTAIGDLPRVDGGWWLCEEAGGSVQYEGPSTDFQRRAREGIDQESEEKLFDHITRSVRADDKLIFSAMDSTTKYSEIDSAVAALSRVSVRNGEPSVGSLKRYRDDIFDDKYKRLDWNQLSRTITAHIAKDGYSYIHPDQDRTLTIREAARIQTFPDWFRFAGPPSLALKQIGNAVPPRLGECLGSAILDSLKSNMTAPAATFETSQLLADWFVKRSNRGELRMPWFSSVTKTTTVKRRETRWQAIQAEILLGKVRESAAKMVWPLIVPLTTPAETLSRRESLLEFSSWIGRIDVGKRVISIAHWLAPRIDHLDSFAGMRSIPNVSSMTSSIAAHVAPGRDDDPVIVTAGILRVAARFSGIPVDRRNSGTDGRIQVARMIGAEDKISDRAYLALIEIAEAVCLKAIPLCSDCPLQKHCDAAEL